MPRIQQRRIQCLSQHCGIRRVPDNIQRWHGNCQLSVHKSDQVLLCSITKISTRTMGLAVHEEE
jgi:hypothetical protein